MTMFKVFRLRVSTAVLSILLCLTSAILHAEVSVHQAEKYSNRIKIYAGEPKNLFNLNWRSFVPKEYAALSPGPIPDSFRSDFNAKTDRYSNVEYAFASKLPEFLPKYYYYLITKSGVREIAINNLEATVRFSLYEDKPSISYVTYWGFLVSDIYDNSANGFVLMSSYELSFKTAKIVLSKGTILKDDTQSSPVEISSPTEQVALSYRIFIHQTKDLFDFVLLNYDRSAFCFERMYLIKNKSYPDVAETSFDGCDV